MDFNKEPMLDREQKVFIFALLLGMVSGYLILALENGVFILKEFGYNEFVSWAILSFSFFGFFMFLLED